MKLLKDMNKAEFYALLNRGMETAKPYGAMCYPESVAVLEGILEDEVYDRVKKSEAKMLEHNCKVSKLATEITKLNELVDKLIAENTDLKTYIEEMHCKWN